MNVQVLVKSSIQKCYRRFVPEMSSLSENNQEDRITALMNHIGKKEKALTRIQTDFIEMPIYNGFTYILMIVCLFYKWVEAHTTWNLDSMTIAKFLSRELIPCFGLLTAIEMKCGSHFKNEI